MKSMPSASRWTVLLLLPFSLSAGEFQFGPQTLTGPDGFIVEKVAGPGLVDRPIVAAFDEAGRLYVADSSGSNDPVQKQLEQKPHRIVRLEDSDSDGKFDKSIVFADKMMFPEGAMWLDGSLYVSAPPSIWKLTDTDNDGVADKREEWFQGKTLTGCANDLHGPYAGPDGWIYWAKGAFAKQTYERPGQPPFVTRAAHIFRARPDGTGIESVMTGGMDNPVDVVFTPEGERIFTTTFFQHPGGGKRDGLIHAVYGGIYGKVHDVLDDHKKTGELMPVLTHLGPAAPCGLTRYDSEVFGPDYRNNLFATLFNLHKVTRHILKPKGATYETEDIDFLVSDSTDFHPTDVLEDADGSLLVIDTGGWYKLCCPTSQLWKPDVLGAIYRVRRQDAPRIPDPRGRNIRWATGARLAALAEHLGDERPAVRRRAIRELAKRGSDALPALIATLRESKSEEAKRNAIWALTHVESEKAREATRRGLKDKSDSVRHVATHSAGVWRDKGAIDLLLKLLEAGSDPLQRAAAEALGRIGDKRAVPALLAGTAKLPAEENALPNRMLEHSLIYALIEIGDVAGTRLAGLDASHPFTRRAALIALDQMKQGGLDANTVAELLSSPNPVLKQTAAWIVASHKDWGDALTGFYTKRLAATDLSEQQRDELASQLARASASTNIQQLLADAALDAANSASRAVALQTMGRSGLKELPIRWHTVISSVLATADSSLVQEAIRATAAVPEKALPAEIKASLARLADRSDLPPEIRFNALAASGKTISLNSGIFDLARSGTRPEQPLALRTAAANLLAKAKLTNEQLLKLADELRVANPLEISRLLAPFEHSTSESVGTRLVASLKSSKGVAGLHADRVKQLLSKYPASVQEQGKELIQRLNQDLAHQAAHVDELLPQLKDGDIRRGQAIFNSAKTACSSCHAIGYLGGKLGPDLTRIGQIRTERDLLEAVLYPSASFVRSYEPVVVVTKSGDDHSGVLRKDAADEVILGTGPDTEVRIARAEIEEIRPGQVSVMPQGLDQQLSKEELADLVAFLKAAR